MRSFLFFLIFFFFISPHFSSSNLKRKEINFETKKEEHVKPLSQKALSKSKFSLFFKNSKNDLPNLSNLFSNPTNKSLLYIFVIVFLAGLLTSFTPCILPMIPITLSLIGTRKTLSKTEGFVLSLFYVLGMAFIYALLGLIAAQTGSLFGSLLGHPVVVILFALLFFLLALSLFGLFEIRCPFFIQKILGKFPSNRSEKNHLFAFISGGIAGIVASPCVGPILAALLAYVSQTQNLILGFFLLFTFSLGLGLLFLFLGTFSQWTLPHLGIWMKRIQYLFGIAMLAISLYLLMPFIKKASFSIRQMIDSTQYKDSSTPPVKKNIIYGYQWVKFSPEALKKAKEDKKPVILDFFASWCIACHKLEKKTFNHESVKSLGQNFLWLKIDVTNPSEEQRKTMKKYNVLGLPKILFFNAKGEWLKALSLNGFEEKDPFIHRMQKTLNHKSLGQVFEFQKK